MAKKKKVKVGICGCGTVARLSHARSFQEMPDTEVVAMYDIKKALAVALAESFAPDARICKSLDEFVNSGIDAAGVSTPNDAHYPCAMAALKAGLHVLCEKPITGTLPEATRLISAAKKARRVLHVNQSFRFMQLYQSVKKVIDDGKIGDVIHVRCLRAGANAPDKGWSPGSKWFVQKKHHGGVILDHGVHMADVMEWLGGEVDSIAADCRTRRPDINVVDNVSAVFRYKNGATGVLEMSWTRPNGGGALEIHGTKGSISQDLFGGGFEIIIPGKKPTQPKLVAEPPSSHRCFIDNITKKIKTPSPGELGRDALALCDAIARAGKSGKFEKVKRY